MSSCIPRTNIRCFFPVQELITPPPQKIGTIWQESLFASRNRHSNLLGQMNTKSHLPVGVRVIGVSPKNLQVMENRTSTATILFRELHCRRCSEVAVGGNTLKLNRHVAAPVLGTSAKEPPALAYHLPIVSRISLTLLTISRHLVLVANRATDAVGMKVGPRSQVHQSYDLPASHGFSGLAEPIVVPLSDLPHSVGRFIVLHGCYKLLSAPGVELPFIAAEQVFASGFHMIKFDGRSARDRFIIVCRSQSK